MKRTCVLCSEIKDCYGKLTVCKDCHKTRMRLRYQENRSNELERMKAYNKNNRARLRVIEQTYYQKHKELWKIKKSKRHIVGDFTLQEWIDIVSYYGKCLACGRTDNLTIDHILPIALGGLHVKENIQPLCSTCNSRKGATFKDYRNVT